MAILKVTTDQDVVDAIDGVLSLREAVARSNASTERDTIQFAPSLEGRALVLTQGEVVLSRDVAIDGDTDNDGTEVTLSGDEASRIIRTVGSGTDTVLRDLTLTDGGSVAEGGAAFLGGGSLTLQGCTVSDSIAAKGGGIYAAAGTVLTVAESSIVDCGGKQNLGSEDFASYASSGGGIYAFRAEVVTRDSLFSGNGAAIDGGAIDGGAVKVAEGSFEAQSATIVDNYAGNDSGALALSSTDASIARSLIKDNASFFLGGAIGSGGKLTVAESTLVNNHTQGVYGGAIFHGGDLVVRNSTITGNEASGFGNIGRGGGIAWLNAGDARLDVANSIVAGNVATDGPDIFALDGAVTSNGHNVFGSEVPGAIAGDRENVTAAALFARIDPDAGGGALGPDGEVALRGSPDNPALSGADPLAAMPRDQSGTLRPLPPGTLPDIGAAESAALVSRVPSPDNDVLAGNAFANTIAGLDGNDLILGRSGRDRLFGDDGSDVLDGGGHDDLLDGGEGIDLALFGGTAAVTLDLAGETDTARRGSHEIDTLRGIEGAIGSSGRDRFLGDDGANRFQGRLSRDIYTLGDGDDLLDFNAIGESPVGAGRDLVLDFVPGQDRFDLTAIDADVRQPGDQAFRWVGSAALGSAAGTLGYVISGDSTIIRGSNDADSQAEFEIELSGSAIADAGDFYL